MNMDNLTTPEGIFCAGFVVGLSCFGFGLLLRLLFSLGKGGDGDV